MKLSRWLSASVAIAAVLVVVCAGVGAGCDKDIKEADAGTKQTPTAPTQPVAPASQPEDGATVAADVDLGPAPETKPAEPAPVLSLLMIDGVAAHFPPTRLLIHDDDDDGKVRVEMVSDLPKSALKDYDGNELYFEMELTPGGEGVEGAHRLDGATWRFKSTSSDKSDSDNGIFLNGPRRHLQPDDVLVKFVREGDQLLAQVVGQFRAYEPGTPDALAPFAVVRGEVTVEIVEQR